MTQLAVLLSKLLGIKTGSSNNLTLYIPKSHNLTKQHSLMGVVCCGNFLSFVSLRKPPSSYKTFFQVPIPSFLPPPWVSLLCFAFFLALSLPLLSLVSLDPIFTCPQFSPHPPAFLSSLLLSAHIFITLSSPSVFSRLSSISSKSSQSLLSLH